MKLKIEDRPIGALIPYARNARTHSDAQVAQIAASIVEFGWTNPILVDGANGVIAGHGRLLAARQLGLETVPVIELAHLTGAQKRAYILADNRLATVAGNVVTAGAFGLLSDGWLAGGFLAWDLGEAGIERRGIRFHEGERLILLGAGDGLRVGQALVAYPGCARTIAICHSKFANAPNYGGVPGLPGKSPFDGTPVF